MNKGILYGAGAYLIWGFFPVYFKLIHAVPAVQILSHRIAWSFVFLGLIIYYRKEAGSLKNVLALPGKRSGLVIAACLLAVNWLTYIWGVNAGFVVETSLGYFINPLVSVMLGVIFLREKLRAWQWVAVGLASIGVLYLTISYGALPWISLVLAFSFGLYGLVKKTLALNSLHGLTLETAVLFIPATLFLFYSEIDGSGALGHLGGWISLLLVLSGPITAIPLLLFGSAARQINLSTLGILQYIAPTCQVFLGVVVYGEEFSRARLLGFGIIWAALLILLAEGVIHQRQRAPRTAAA